MKIGVLHPGQMGISLAAALQTSHSTVCWAAAGRSALSVDRAEAQGLTDCGSVEQLCAQCDVLFSVCPPGEAKAVAESVVAAGFKKIYVDCNAIAPSTSTDIAALLKAQTIEFVDGGIIGPPAWDQGSTRLYLSGQNASETAALFKDSFFEAICLDEKAGSASALKMAYAAWTKGSDALLLNVFALAEHHGLAQALTQEWEISQKGLRQKLDRAARINAPKGWRFVGEMEQIDQTLSDAGLANGAFESAAAVYAALSDFKSAAASDITTESVINALKDSGKKG